MTTNNPEAGEPAAPEAARGGQDGAPGGPVVTDSVASVTADPVASVTADSVAAVTEVAADLAAVSRRARWVGPLFAVLAVLMVPWTVYLAITLPQEQKAAHYDLAWAGFDVGLFAVLVWSAWAAVRRSRWLPVAASLNAGFLVVDAWFDVVTAPDRRELMMAVASAALIELPLAAVSVWLAVNGQRIIEHRITLHVLRRRHRHVSRRH
jgi:hypothetical protein